MNGRSEPSSARPAPEPPLDKRTIRLPDGRELTYYRFPEAPPRPAGPAPRPPAQER